MFKQLNMFFVIPIYILLLAVFLIFSALIFRHAVRYAYLSPRFKTIVTVFGVMALLIIIFSLYMLIQIFAGAPASPSLPSIPMSTTGNGDFNF